MKAARPHEGFNNKQINYTEKICNIYHILLLLVPNKLI